MPTRTVSALVLLSLIACTATSSTSSVTSSPEGSHSPEIVAAVPDTCPKHLPAHASSRGIAGTRRWLVPGEPTVLVICQASRAVVDGQRLDQLVRHLNALKRAPAKGLYACPLNLGPVYWLFFDYPEMGTVQVTVEAGGCRFASNGRYQAWTSRTVLLELGRLVRRGA
jgi:hypothetical protein